MASRAEAAADRANGRRGDLTMKEPVDHILRPKLPWRTGEGAITECGYDAAKVPPP